MIEETAEQVERVKKCLPTHWWEKKGRKTIQCKICGMVVEMKRDEINRPVYGS